MICTTSLDDREKNESACCGRYTARLAMDTIYVTFADKEVSMVIYYETRWSIYTTDIDEELKEIIGDRRLEIVSVREFMSKCDELLTE